jgi:hypothetical protein
VVGVPSQWNVRVGGREWGVKGGVWEPTPPVLRQHIRQQAEGKKIWRESNMKREGNDNSTRLPTAQSQKNINSKHNSEVFLSLELTMSAGRQDCVNERQRGRKSTSRRVGSQRRKCAGIFRLIIDVASTIFALLNLYLLRKARHPEAKTNKTNVSFDYAVKRKMFRR